MKNLGSFDPTRSELAPQSQVTDIRYTEDREYAAYTGEGAVVDVAAESMFYGQPEVAALVMHGASGKRYYTLPSHEGTGILLTDADPQNKDPDKRMSYTVIGGRFPRLITLGQEITLPDAPANRQIHDPIIRVDIPKANGNSKATTQPVTKQGMGPISLYWGKFDRATQVAWKLGKIPTRT